VTFAIAFIYVAIGLLSYLTTVEELASPAADYPAFTDRWFLLVLCMLWPLLLVALIIMFFIAIAGVIWYDWNH